MILYPTINKVIIISHNNNKLLCIRLSEDRKVRKLQRLPPVQNDNFSKCAIQSTD